MKRREFLKAIGATTVSIALPIKLTELNQLDNYMLLPSIYKDSSEVIDIAIRKYNAEPIFSSYLSRHGDGETGYSSLIIPKNIKIPKHPGFKDRLRVLQYGLEIAEALSDCQRVWV